MLLGCDGCQFVGVPLEGNGVQGPDDDMGVAGLKFAPSGDAIPTELAPDGGKNRVAPTRVGLLLLSGPLAVGEPQRHQADDHASGDGDHEGGNMLQPAGC